MFKKIAIVIVVLIVALLAYAATQPDTFRVQRAASIKAPPEKVFALLNDFQRWEAWSPWEKKDPAMKRTFSAVSSGKGAQYAWEATGRSARVAWKSRSRSRLPVSRSSWIS